MSHSSLDYIEKSRRVHTTYFSELERLYRFAIPEGMRVLELGCHTGRLLVAVNPAFGMGVDSDIHAIETAREIFSDRENVKFVIGDCEEMDWSEYQPFDYIILSDLTPLLNDIETTFRHLHAVCIPSTRIILNFQNNLWNPALRLASLFGLRKRYAKMNWLSMQDIQNLLYLSGFQIITKGTRVLAPFQFPLLTSFLNRFLSKVPIIEQLSLTCFIIARPEPVSGVRNSEDYSVSIMVPTRNEKGNIAGIFDRTPKMGRWTELVFVDGHSEDGTIEAIEEGIANHGHEWHRTILIHQTGKGKGQAVRQGFEACNGDILMILDSDLTMPPEDLPKYYEAIKLNRAEFINGSRLVYPMDKRAMRFLNMIANKLFAIMFTWLLGQPVKDTLCGTKVLWRADYLKIAHNRSYFGDFDPFGDFDLLFGASRLNLKIVDLPIRYRERVYGDIKISRWKHGWLLLRMCLIAFKKLKLS